MIIAAAATAASAWMLQPVMDEIFVDKRRDLILPIVGGVIAIFVIKGIATYAQSVIMKTIGQRATTDMQMDMYSHLLHADIKTFSDQSSGSLISRFTNDIHIIRRNFTQALTGFAKETLTLVGLFGLMFYQSWELTLLTLVIFPTVIYPILRLGKRMRRVSRKTQEELGVFTSKLDDTFQGVRIVKAYGREESEINQARTVVERIYQLYVKSARTESAASPIMETVAGVAIGAVIWYGGDQVLTGETSPGAFFSFIAALLMAYKPMKSLSGLNNNLQDSLAAVSRLFTVLDAEPSIKNTKGAKPLSTNQWDINFNKVNFSYNDERPALTDLTLTVPFGKRVALVGPSGGGKSTIMNMILRFYDPDNGTISIDKTDIRHVTLDSLRNHIAVVNQEATLFDDTIRANISYGKPDATDEEIIEAAKSAAAHDFITEQAQGYSTQIGQHGLRLSGGQRQRLAIARAMLRNAPILLLDEATSALDTASEQKVQQALETLMQGKTSLVIAHRLSTIMDADLIYVIENGHVSESGTHQELLAKKSTYYNLCRRQFDLHDNE